AEFDWLGVFAYSDEETAESFALDGKVDDETIARRRYALMAIQRKISARKRRAMVGRRVAAMLEGPSRESNLVWEARLEGMAPEIDGKVYITDFDLESGAQAGPPAPPGTMATIEITEAHDYDLIARVVGLRPAAEKPREASFARQNGGKPPRSQGVPVVRIATGAPLRVLP
ncbi:MAG: hypothetical protein ACRD5W_13760, partial [Candidatus Acidiferrales bacterium]